MKRIDRSDVVAKVPSRFPDAINCSPEINFSQIPNEMARDPLLSAKAKGILLLLLSNRKGWCSYIETITNMMSDGKDAIYSGIKELEKRGYLLRLRYKEKTTKKYRGSIWCYAGIPNTFFLSEEMWEFFASHNLELVTTDGDLVSVTDGKITITATTKTGKAGFGFPGSGFPGSGFPAANNTNNNNTNNNNTNNIFLPTSNEVERNISIGEKVGAGKARSSNYSWPNLENNIPGRDENNSDKNSSNILSETAKAESVEIANEKTKADIKKRNKQFEPFAIKLAEIIQTNKNIRITQAKIKSWSSSIRQLTEIEGVEPNRIQTVLHWYESNVGGNFVPIIECGNSLREKFTRLEDAMKRQNNNSAKFPKVMPANNSANNSAKSSIAIPACKNITSGKALNTAAARGPLAVIRQKFGEDLGFAFEKDCYAAAKELFPGLPNANKAELVESLLYRYDRIANNWDSLPAERKTLDYLGPMTVLEQFIEWLSRQDWITDRRISIFRQDKLFDRFYSEYAKW